MIKFQANTIIQSIDGQEKIWTVPELLETYDPLVGESLSDRNAAMKQVADMAMDQFDDLSDAALLQYDFWKQIKPTRIEEHKYEYTTKVSQTYHWELTINEEGLFYKDISPEYGQAPGTVCEQMLSDFWFYGPLMPIPDLDIRKWVVAHIRNAFLQAGSSASYAHFKLFEYPAPHLDPKQWVNGDHVASEFITLRDYGIEYGSQNWRDGLVYLNFLSFEQFLSRSGHLPLTLTPEIRQGIHQYLMTEPGMAPLPGHEIAQYPTKMAHTQQVEAKNKTDLLSNKGSSVNEKYKQLFMDNGGRTHYIHLDGDVYNATPTEEEAWRKELIENYTQRLKEETNETVLCSIAETLLYNKAANVKEMLLERAATANDRDKQTIAIVLGRLFDDADSVKLLVSLLEQEPADYWLTFVFNSFFHLFKNTTAKRFIIECLQGDNEVYFKKAVDVVQMWGYTGNNKLLDKKVMGGLIWEDACADDPNFSQSLEMAIKIILK